MTIVVDGYFSDLAVAVAGGLITLLLVAIWRRPSLWICMQLRRTYGWLVTIFTPTLKAARKPRRIAMISTDGKSPIVQDQAYEELARQLETTRREMARLRARYALKQPMACGGVKAADIGNGVKLGDALRKAFGRKTNIPITELPPWGVKAADIGSGVKLGDALGKAFGMRTNLPITELPPWGVKAADIGSGVKLGDALGKAFGMRTPSS